jgi:hypothetical protein
LLVLPARFATTVLKHRAEQVARVLLVVNDQHTYAVKRRRAIKPDAVNADRRMIALGLNLLARRGDEGQADDESRALDRAQDRTPGNIPMRPKVSRASDTNVSSGGLELEHYEGSQDRKPILPAVAKGVTLYCFSIFPRPLVRKRV